MARLAPDNSATRAESTAALRVLAAWDVAGDASEHAGHNGAPVSGWREATEAIWHRIDRPPTRKRLLGEGLMGKAAVHFEFQVLHLIQPEAVERGSIAIQNQDANIGIGRLMQDFQQ